MASGLEMSAVSCSRHPAQSARSSLQLEPACLRIILGRALWPHKVQSASTSLASRRETPDAFHATRREAVHLKLWAMGKRKLSTIGGEIWQLEVPQIFHHSCEP